mgnify:CR=1 FL=1
MNDILQVDYLPDEKKIKINLPEEVKIINLNNQLEVRINL